jgi:hypothetical protein
MPKTRHHAVALPPRPCFSTGHRPAPPGFALIELLVIVASNA